MATYTVYNAPKIKVLGMAAYTVYNVNSQWPKDVDMCTLSSLLVSLFTHPSFFLSFPCSDLYPPQSTCSLSLALSLEGEVLVCVSCHNILHVHRILGLCKPREVLKYTYMFLGGV